MALEVRRVDVVTGELRMPWTTFPSQSAAARALKAKGADSTISKLVRGLEPHWNGFEARLCTGRSADLRQACAGFANNGAQASARPLSRPVEVRCSLERVRERAARECATSRTNQIAPHSERGDPSLSAFGVPGATH